VKPGVSFSIRRFREVWATVPPETQLEIRHYASTHGLSLAGVMRAFYPDLWAALAAEEPA
jgi:hypothetical protein